MILTTLLALVALLPAAPVTGPTGDDTGDRAVIAEQMPTYPLDVCLVSGEPLGDGAVNAVHDGRLARFCCSRCAGKLESDPEKFIDQVDAAVVRAQSKDYPLESCPLKGKPLNDRARDVVVGTRLVKVCCTSCERVVKGDPTKAMAALDAAYIRAQQADYPMDVCLVSGEPLGDEPLDVLYGNMLIRLCCKGCKKEYAKAPAAFADKVAMRKARAARAGEHGGRKGGDHGDGHDGGGRGEHGGRGDHDGDHDG